MELTPKLQMPLNSDETNLNANVTKYSTINDDVMEIIVHDVVMMLMLMMMIMVM